MIKEKSTGVMKLAKVITIEGRYSKMRSTMKFTCKRGETTNTFYPVLPTFTRNFYIKVESKRVERKNIKKNCLTFWSFIWAFWEKIVAK